MRVKNNKVTDDTWAGMTIAAAGEYDLQATEISVWQASDKVIADLSSGDLLVGDGVTYQTAGALAVNFLLGTGVKDVSVQAQPSFTSKKIGTKSLFIRATGKVFPVVVGANTLDISIPYDVMKFNGLQIVNGKVGETVNLKVLDTPAGLISGVPNYMLNQFGFNVNLLDGEFIRESKYDADIYKDMVVRIELTAIEARDFRVNYSLHEVK